MDEMTKSLRIGVLERENAKLDAELRLLRSLIGDRLEEHGITVKRENVADVVRWAKNPDAVRELLKHTPTLWVNSGPECPHCAAEAGESHSRVVVGLQRVECAVVAAWRTLGDPRGAEDIERAHEEAIEFEANLHRSCEHRFLRLTHAGGETFMQCAACFGRMPAPFSVATFGMERFQIGGVDVSREEFERFTERTALPPPRSCAHRNVVVGADGARCLDCREPVLHAMAR